MSASAERGHAVREAAARILVRVEAEDAFAGPLLEGAEPRFDDPRDRALLHETVLGVLRHVPEIDRAFARVSARKPRNVDPVVRAAVRIGLHALLFLDRIPDHAAVHASVEAARRLGAGRATGFVNAVLRRAAREGASLRAPDPTVGDAAALALVAGHPAWWVRRLVAREGWARARAVVEADNRPAPTVLRVRAGHDVDAVRAALAADGVGTVPSPWLPRALRVASGTPTAASAFADGTVTVQDEASQMVPDLARGGVPGPALDCCAAPGGKAIQLAEEGGGRTVVAIDRSAARLARVAENVRRMRTGDVLAVLADVERAVPPVAPGSAAVVLVDAPCSGTGTLRRHPEIRLRLRPEHLAAFARRQAAILENAAAAVAPGGRLVYAVCSIEPEEGPAVVEGFARRVPGFRRLDAAALLDPRCRPLVAPDGTLRTTPADDLDGFFAAAFERA